MELPRFSPEAELVVIRAELVLRCEDALRDPVKDFDGIDTKALVELLSGEEIWDEEVGEFGFSESEYVEDLIRRARLLLHGRDGAPLDPHKAPEALGGLLVIEGHDWGAYARGKYGKSPFLPEARNLVAGSAQGYVSNIVSGSMDSFFDRRERILPLMGSEDFRVRSWAISRLAEIDVPLDQEPRGGVSRK